MRYLKWPWSLVSPILFFYTKGHGKLVTWSVLPKPVIIKSKSGSFFSWISRRKTANRFLPPLPTLDIPSTPEYKHLLNKPSTSSTASQGTPTTNGASVDYFPSPSQVQYPLYINRYMYLV